MITVIAKRDKHSEFRQSFEKRDEALKVYNELKNGEHDYSKGYKNVTVDFIEEKKAGGDRNELH